jgi:CheY-like chemotaxis protein
MKKKILIIDDMPEALVVLMAYLTSEGYEVITAQNGAEGLTLVAANTPDLVISDIMMPKMGGFEFIEKLRRDHSVYIPIVFMSAKDKNVAEKLAMDLGADGFLEKPVSFTVIKATVEAALAKSKRAAANSEQSPYVEQRKSKRAPFICEAYFEGGGISGFTVASNLSRGGLFLDTFSSIPPGTLLQLRLKLQPGYEIEVAGEVCYGIKGSGVGVKFINLDQESAEVVDRIVEGVLNRSKSFGIESASVA